MEEQFVTYEIASKLKELGFDEPCIAYYDYYKNLILCRPLTQLNTLNNEIDAPLWQQVIDWFRERYNICIVINCVNWRNGKQFEGYLCKFQTKEMIDKGDYSKYLHLTDLFVTYEEAREQAILKAIELC